LTNGRIARRAVIEDLIIPFRCRLLQTIVTLPMFFHGSDNPQNCSFYFWNLDPI